MAFHDAQRLAFGSVAELYDRARPSYPAAAIADVMAHAGLRGGDQVLEVGAGTGKATVLLAQRGLRVVAIEPSPAMAGLARTNCRPFGDAVEVVESEFEGWDAPRRFPALVSAAAWHWIAPEVRYPLAGRAVAPGGTLACLWTFPDWERCPVRDELAAVYARSAPSLTPDFPMHPASEPTRLAGDWRADIADASAFHDPQVLLHSGSQSYSSTAYVELLQTHQDHILLAAGERSRLLEAIAEAIEAKGAATITLPLVTRVCLARRH